MSASPERDSNALGETQMLLVNRLCNQFEADWQAGRQPALEEMLTGLPTTDRQAVLRDLLPLEIEYRQQAGESPNMDDYAQRFPDADREWLGSLFYSTRVSNTDSGLLATIPEQLGDYRILGRIGGGGMGAVFKALHMRMNRIVALKILRPDVHRNEHMRQRFEREMRTAARLTHPNIVAALDAREQDGLHYLITEYVDGLDLDEIVRRNGPLTVAEAVNAILQAARGLDFAHGQGVIHRDIKPANLLRNADGLVKVLDMGLARIEAEADTRATDLTNSGMVLGTVAYMAPEQARDVRRADARSDIYSLGCTLYFLLTGRPAFTGASPIDTLLSHLNEPSPTLTNENDAASIALQRIFAQMIAKEPDDRFQSAAELIGELEKLQTLVPSSDNRVMPLQSSADDFDFPTEALRGLKLAQAETHVVDEEVEEPRTWRKWLLAVGALVAAIIIALSLPYIMSITPPNQAKQPSQEQAEQPQGVDAIGRYSLSFNGTSSYVSVPSLEPIAGGTYTLEAVVEPGSTQIGNVISFMGPDWMGLYLRERTWGLARAVGSRSYLIEARQPAEIGTVVHVAGVYRGERLQLYIDGKRADFRNSEYQMPKTKPGLFIGGSPLNRLPEDHNHRFFGGRIHTVRISKGERYRADFDPPQKFLPDKATLGLYHFHKGSGTVVKDVSGHEHDGEIHNAKWVKN